jgi:iron complex transport system substrate-binding protein
MGLWKALAGAAALGWAAAVSGPAAARPERIVSFNACADGYLLALADRSQIAALTQFARDPAYSVNVAQARTYPYTKGQAEAVLALRPDLVIASPYRRAESLALLKGRARIVDLPPANSFDEIVQQTRMVAAAIGQSARGEALIKAMRARVDAAGRRPLGGVAAYYERGGILIGTGSLMDDLMTRAGLINLARKLHKGALGRLSLEGIVYARPDYLILGNEAGRGQDEGGQMLDHPALTRAVPLSRRLHIPSALTACGGPAYPDALERLQAEADRVRAGGASTGFAP